MVELAKWTSSLQRALTPSDDPKVAKSTSSYAISRSEAEELAGVAIGELSSRLGIGDKDPVADKMYLALTRNWEDNYAAHVKPEGAARPLLERVAKLTDRAQLDVVRDAALKMRGDIDDERTKPDNIALSNPQLNRLEDFVTVVYEAVGARLRTLESLQGKDEPNAGARKAALRGATTLHVPQAIGAMNALKTP